MGIIILFGMIGFKWYSVYGQLLVVLVFIFSLQIKLALELNLPLYVGTTVIIISSVAATHFLFNLSQKL